MTDYLFVAGGLLLLIAGGEALVRGSTATAERLGMSPLLIGLTLVAFGTSAPELVTSIQASLSGVPGIAIGNIVGSNIANILLILGVAALVAPIAMSRSAVRSDGGAVLAATVLFCAIAFVTPLDRSVGLIFIAALAVYLYSAYRRDAAEQRTAAAANRAADTDGAETGPISAGAGGGDGLAFAGAGGQVSAIAVQLRTTAVLTPLAMTLAGFLLLFLGARFLVDGATNVARTLGVTEAVIGLTVVAIGTSLPELVASVMAALRRQSDLALGNILGSNLYNILGIGGVTALIAPTTIPAEIVNFDNLVMLGVTIGVLALAWFSPAITRRQGAVLAAAYGLYLFSLWPA